MFFRNLSRLYNYHFQRLVSFAAPEFEMCLKKGGISFACLTKPDDYMCQDWRKWDVRTLGKLENTINECLKQL